MASTTLHSCWRYFPLYDISTEQDGDDDLVIINIIHVNRISGTDSIGIVVPHNKIKYMHIIGKKITLLYSKPTCF